MKKFLTVLLVIAVMFTFSFSTSFADTTEQTTQEKCNAAVATAQENAEKAINAKAAEFVYTQKDMLNTPAGYELYSKSDVEAGVKAAIKTAKDAIQVKATELVKDNDWSDEDTTALNDLYKTVDEAVILGKQEAAVATPALARVKAALKAELITDTSKYTEADAAKIKSAVETAQKAIDEAKENTYANVEAVDAAKTAYETAIKDIKTVDAYNADLAKDKADSKAKLAKQAETFKAEYKAELEAAIKDTENNSPADITQAKAMLAALDSNVAKILDYYNKQIDAVELDKTNATPYDTAKTALGEVEAAGLYALSKDGYMAAVEKLATNDMLAAYAKQYAEGMKKEYAKDETGKETGLPTYNAATVDKQLETVLKDVNAGKYDTYSEVETALREAKEAADEASDLEAAKTAAKDAITKGVYAEDKYEGDNAKAAKAIQDEYVAKIKGATTAEEIANLEKEAKAKLDKVMTKEIAGQQNGKAMAEADKFKDQLGKYFDGLVAKNPGAYDESAKNKVVEAAKEAMAQAVADKNDPSLTDEQIKKLVDDSYAKGIAAIDSMKTKEQAAADKKAVEDAIAALPTTPTLADKAKYDAVKKQRDDYMKTPGATAPANNDVLDAYLDRLQAMEKEAVEKQIAALPENPTMADADAVEAAQAAYDAYKENYPDAAEPTNKDKLDKAAKAVSADKALDAAKKIAALPENPTMADAAAVEAAKAAYDALTDNEKATLNSALKTKLDAAVKQVAALKVDAVQKVQITASSSAVKGAITVKWTIKGSKSACKGFQIWRSTKKSSGFKKMFTTSKYSYKNSKGLKKGVRYYYKVRAYNRTADGKLLFSDWSNKAYRIAK